MIAGGSDGIQLRRESYSFQLASGRWQRGPDLLQPRSFCSSLLLSCIEDLSFQDMSWSSHKFESGIGRPVDWGALQANLVWSQ